MEKNEKKIPSTCNSNETTSVEKKKKSIKKNVKNYDISYCIWSAEQKKKERIVESIEKIGFPIKKIRKARKIKESDEYLEFKSEVFALLEKDELKYNKSDFKKYTLKKSTSLEDESKKQFFSALEKEQLINIPCEKLLYYYMDKLQMINDVEENNFILNFKFDSFDDKENLELVSSLSYSPTKAKLILKEQINRLKEKYVESASEIKKRFGSKNGDKLASHIINNKLRENIYLNLKNFINIGILTKVESQHFLDNIVEVFDEYISSINSESKFDSLMENKDSFTDLFVFFLEDKLKLNLIKKQEAAVELVVKLNARKIKNSVVTEDSIFIYSFIESQKLLIQLLLDSIESEEEKNKRLTFIDDGTEIRDGRNVIMYDKNNNILYDGKLITFPDEMYEAHKFYFMQNCIKQNSEKEEVIKGLIGFVKRNKLKSKEIIKILNDGQTEKDNKIKERLEEIKELYDFMKSEIEGFNYEKNNIEHLKIAYIAIYLGKTVSKYKQKPSLILKEVLSKKNNRNLNNLGIEATTTKFEKITGREEENDIGEKMMYLYESIRRQHCIERGENTYEEMHIVCQKIIEALDEISKVIFPETQLDMLVEFHDKILDFIESTYLKFFYIQK